MAYVYVPNTAGSGYEYFKRYFFPQADKEAIIVDERFNGGGQVADYYIDLLRRPLVSYWATRHGEPIRTPSAAILGPKVMIIDETAGSGGDLLPWMFRKFGLGKLVGKRTWGGLVGILGFPVLMDGGSVTAPDLAIFTEDGWVVENVGVPPDIEVEQDPAAVAAGKDPQLDRAIEVVLAELAKNPPPKPLARPPFPVRVRPQAGAERRKRRCGRGEAERSVRRGRASFAVGHLTCRQPACRRPVRGAGERYESKTRTFSQLSLFSSTNFWCRECSWYLSWASLLTKTRCSDTSKSRSLNWPFRSPASVPVAK